MEMKCRSLGRLKDVEFWGGKLAKTSGRLENVDLKNLSGSVDMKRKTWKNLSVDCRV